jgi:hypothetical protein
MESDSDNDKASCYSCRHLRLKCRRLIKRIKELETLLLNKEFECFIRSYYYDKFSIEEL